jgi:siroheme synthase-like protein
MRFGFPVFLALDGVPVLLVGGGRVALRKAAALVDEGAVLTVVAPGVLPELAALAGSVRQRPYAAGDVHGHRLVIVASDDPQVNAQVSADATAAGIWVNSADDPQHCSFILPAVARRGAVTVAVSTGGASPALAGHLRDEIATTTLTEAVERAAADLAAQRAAIHATGRSTEAFNWTARVRAALDAWNWYVRWPP